MRAPGLALACALFAACSAQKSFSPPGPSDAGAPSGGSSGSGTGGATASTGGAGGSSGTGGSSGSDAAAPADAATQDALGPPPCGARITQLTAGSASSVIQGTEIHLRAHDDTRPKATWTWSVRREGDPAEKPLPPLPSEPSEVEVVLADVAHYYVTALEYPGCAAVADFMTVTPQELTAVWLRLVPPRDAGAAPSIVTVNVPAGQSSTRDLVVSEARPVYFEPTGEGAGAPTVPSYVRVEVPQAGLRLEGYTRSGPFVVALAPGMTYQALVVPDPDTHLAPRRFNDLPTNFNPPLVIDAGMTVSGTVTGLAGPVPDARVLLGNGDLPSTVGVVSAQGTFTLHARGDQLGATVFPPIGSPLPQARLAPGQVTFSDGARLDFAWKALNTASLSLDVRAAGGSAPAAGVPVHLASAGPGLPDVGTFHAASGDFSASGSVTLDGTTNARGALTFTAVPVGQYILSLGPAGGAVTVLPISVSAPSSAQMVSLARPIQVSGSVTPAALGTGATVVAIDLTADASRPVPAGQIDKDGKYVLMVDPGPTGGERSYHLYVEPSASRPRVPLGQVIVTDHDVTIEPRPIPAALTLSGIARLSNAPLRGVFIQAYCVGASVDCVNPPTVDLDQLRPVAEATTDASGAFRLSLPDPATLLAK